MTLAAAQFAALEFMKQFNGGAKVSSNTTNADLPRLNRTHLMESLGVRDTSQPDVEHSGLPPFKATGRLADLTAREMGWKFGSQVRAELRSIFYTLRRDGASESTGIGVRAPGRLLEEYFIANLLKRERMPHVFSVADAHDRERFAVLRDEPQMGAFHAAIEKSVAHLAQKKDSKGIKSKILVVDAGCGPSAVLGILAALQSDRVKVTAVDSSLAAVEIARAIVRKFGLENQIAVLHGDPTSWEPAGSGQKIDLLLSNALGSALTREPFVQIASNLSRFVPDYGIVLPSRIRVSSALRSMEEQSSPLNEAAGFDYFAGSHLPSALRLQVPSAAKRFSAWVWSTFVCMKSELVRQGQSALTTPVQVYDFFERTKPFVVSGHSMGNHSIEILFAPGGKALGKIVEQ